MAQLIIGAKDGRSFSSSEIFIKELGLQRDRFGPQHL